MFGGFFIYKKAAHHPASDKRLFTNNPLNLYILYTYSAKKSSYWVLIHTYRSSIAFTASPAAMLFWW